MAKKQKPLPTTSGGFAAFMERELDSGGPAWRYGRWELWRGFIAWELAFLQEDDLTVADLEAKKPDAVGTWKRWREALHAATKAAPYDDHLGVAYMLLSMGQSGWGQYFTPPQIARLMAAILGGRATLPEDGHLERAHEPCCGSGVMVLASEAHRQEEGLLPCVWTLIDLDMVCCMMAAIQCSLNDIPAVVLCVNSLYWGAPGHELATLVSPRVHVEVGGKITPLKEVTQNQAGLIERNLEAHALAALEQRKQLQVERAG